MPVTLNLGSHRQRVREPQFPALPPPSAAASPAGKYIENHGVVHNMYYNTSSKVKLPYHTTLGIQRWWDNGSVPIWITAQRQVKLPPQAHDDGRGGGAT